MANTVKHYFPASDFLRHKLSVSESKHLKTLKARLKVTLPFYSIRRKKSVPSAVKLVDVSTKYIVIMANADISLGYWGIRGLAQPIRYLDSFESYLRDRDNKTFFVGSRLSLVDFVLYELFWQMTMTVPNSITTSKRPTLFAFIKTFDKEPRIANYLQHEDHIERPVNIPWASFTWKSRR